jgi:hypothetical protein
VKGYNVYRGDRVGKRGGGVLLAVPNHFQSYEIKDSFSNESFEALSVKIQLKQQFIAFILVYRNPTKNDQMFIPAFKKYYESLNVEKSSHVILGDFNFPEINWKDSTTTPGFKISAAFLEFVHISGLEQIVPSPTRKQNLLDIILTSETGMLYDVEILTDFYGSDHDQVECKIGALNHKLAIPSRRNFFKTNFDEMRKEISLFPYNWNEIFSFCNSADEMYDVLLRILKDLISIYVPLVKKTQLKQIMPSKLKRLFAKQKRLYRKFKKTNDENIKAIYKEVGKEIRSEIRQSYFRRENEILQSKNERSFWQYVRSKLKFKPTIPALKEGNQIITDDKQKAEAFNEYFCSVFTVDNGQCTPHAVHPHQSICEQCCFTACKKNYWDTHEKLLSGFGCPVNYRIKDDIVWLVILLTFLRKH